MIDGGFVLVGGKHQMSSISQAAQPSRGIEILCSVQHDRSGAQTLRRTRSFLCHHQLAVFDPDAAYVVGQLQLVALLGELLLQGVVH